MLIWHHFYFALISLIYWNERNIKLDIVLLSLCILYKAEYDTNIRLQHSTSYSITDEPDIHWHMVNKRIQMFTDVNRQYRKYIKNTLLSSQFKNKEKNKHTNKTRRENTWLWQSWQTKLAMWGRSRDLFVLEVISNSGNVPFLKRLLKIQKPYTYVKRTVFRLSIHYIHSNVLIWS